MDGITATFSEARALLRKMTKGDAQEIAECMHAAGFPQLLQLRADSASDAVTSSSEDNDLAIIQPHEMGPYTESQAREFGLIGSKYIGASGRSAHGNVISNDPAYEIAYDSCRDASRGVMNSHIERELPSISQAVSDIDYAIRSQLIARSEPVWAALLQERIDCVRDSGYEAIDFGRLDGSWEMLLQQVGIQPGETQSQRIEGTEIALSELEAPLEPGETRLIPGSEIPVARYYPSAAEVELALAYVKCGEEIDFVEQLEKLQVPIREEVLADYELEILGLQERIEALADGDILPR